MQSFLLALLLSQARAQNACQKLNPMSADVPSCPSNNLPTDNLFPAMAMTISDATGGPEFVTSVVKKVIAANPSAPPQFLIGGEQATIDAVKKEIQSSDLPPDRKALYLSSITRVPNNEYNWQQDFMQAYVNPSTGRPVLREVTQYKGVRNEMKDAFASITAASQSCGITAGPPLATKEDLVNGMFGGNIEGGPGGLCLLGDDHFVAGQWDEFAKQACANSKAVVKVPTKFLSVGHVDEVVTSVRLPGKQAPCNFAVLVASPREGLAALRSKSKTPAIQYAGVGDAENLNRTRFQNDTFMPSPFEAMCKAYQKSQKQTPLPSKTSGTRSVSWLEHIIPSAFGSVIPDASSDGDSSFHCNEIASGDMASTLQKDSELGAYNESLQRDFDQFKSEYAKALKQANPSCGEPTFIDVPDLFHGHTIEKEGHTMAAEGDGWNGLSLYSNPTNNVQIGETILMPDPGNANFRDALSAKLQAIGLKTDFVDTYFAHSQQGNLHCSTNAIRYCKPTTGAQR